MKLKTVLKTTLLTAVITSTFSGCAMDEIARKYSPEGVEKMLRDKLSGKSKENLVKDFKEPTLAKPFMKFYDMPRHSLEYTRETIKLTNQWVHFSDNVYMNRVDAYIADHSSNNEFAEVYKKAVKERGNKYKVFTSKFNKKVIETLYGGRRLPSIDREHMLLLKWDKIPMLAEFDKDNKLISILVFKIEVGAAFNKLNNPNVQSEIILNGIIAVGSTLNPIKNSISKKEWEENEL